MKILKCGKGIETVFVPTPKPVSASTPVVVHSRPAEFRQRIEYVLKGPTRLSEPRCVTCHGILAPERINALASLKLAPETWKCVDCIYDMATNFKKKDSNEETEKDKLESEKKKGINVTYFCEKCNGRVSEHRVTFLRLFNVPEDEFRCTNCCLEKEVIKRFIETES